MLIKFSFDSFIIVPMLVCLVDNGIDLVVVFHEEGDPRTFHLQLRYLRAKVIIRSLSSCRILDL